jgi:hypothetical protein
MYKIFAVKRGGQLVVDSQCIKRLSDNAFIPFCEDNTDYQEYLKWLAEGNAPIGADTPLPSDSVAGNSEV